MHDKADLHVSLDIRFLSMASSDFDKLIAQAESSLTVNYANAERNGRSKRGLSKESDLWPAVKVTRIRQMGIVEKWRHF